MTNPVTFKVLEDIARDLSGSEITFPTFLDITFQVRSALKDPNLSVDQLSKLVGAEPLMSAKIIRMANSVALNPSVRESELIALRKQYAVIVYGNYTLLDTGDLPLYAYLRQLEEQTLIVICNFSRDNVRWELPLSTQGATCLIANYPQDNTPGKTLTLKPYEAIVYLVRDRI